MTLSDLITTVNTYIGDTSTDRVSNSDRYGALTEATSWLLEELGNEHMVDRAEIVYLPTVTWYKMDTLTPYLLTAGQLRFKEEKGDRFDFTRVEARDLASMPANRHAYAIERYNGDSYLGINIPVTNDSKSESGCYTELIGMDINDGLTYVGINADEIVKESNAIRFDMATGSASSTGLTTTSNSIDLSDYQDLGYIIFEFEIPDIEDVTSVRIKFGDDLSTDYWYALVAQDVNGNPLTAGVNTIKVEMAQLSVIGTPTISDITKWEWTVNHISTKPQIGGFRLSDLRVAKPIYLTFKYIFYRVGKDTNEADITEFSATTDVPFFAERYPQYRWAVAHKAAAILFRSLQLIQNARTEESEANKSLDRYRKNFAGERDMGSSAFKVAGINFRGRRLYKRR